MKKRKNIKQAIAILGLSILIVPSTALVVVGCNEQKTIIIPKKDPDKLVVEAINKTSYEINVLINSSVKDLKNKINTDFIKAKLGEENKKNFHEKNFSLVTIFNEDDKEITGIELSFKRNFLAKIIYNYGAIKNQRTNLLRLNNCSIEHIAWFGI